MTDRDEITDLMARLAKGPPQEEVHETARRIPKPMYHLDVDSLDPRSIILQIRTGDDSVPRGQLFLPDWQEIEATVDGPHEMDIAIPLADDYAWEMDYHGISIDIESSQLWNPEWGVLEKDGPIED